MKGMISHSMIAATTGLLFNTCQASPTWRVTLQVERPSVSVFLDWWSS